MDDDPLFDRFALYDDVVREALATFLTDYAALIAIVPGGAADSVPQSLHEQLVVRTLHTIADRTRMTVRDTAIAPVDPLLLQAAAERWIVSHPADPPSAVADQLAQGNYPNPVLQTEFANAAWPAVRHAMAASATEPLTLPHAAFDALRRLAPALAADSAIRADVASPGTQAGIDKSLDTLVQRLAAAVSPLDADLAWDVFHCEIEDFADRARDPDWRPRPARSEAIRQHLRNLDRRAAEVSGGVLLPADMADTVRQQLRDRVRGIAFDRVYTPDSHRPLQWQVRDLREEIEREVRWSRPTMAARPRESAEASRVRDRAAAEMLAERAALAFPIGPGADIGAISRAERERAPEVWDERLRHYSFAKLQQQLIDGHVSTRARTAVQWYGGPAPVIDPSFERDSSVQHLVQTAFLQDRAANPATQTLLRTTAQRALVRLAMNSRRAQSAPDLTEAIGDTFTSDVHAIATLVAEDNRLGWWQPPQPKWPDLDALKALVDFDRTARETGSDLATVPAGAQKLMARMFEEILVYGREVDGRPAPPTFLTWPGGSELWSQLESAARVHATTAQPDPLAAAWVLDPAAVPRRVLSPGRRVTRGTSPGNAPSASSGSERTVHFHGRWKRPT